jgi:hypothetical protein
VNPENNIYQLIMAKHNVIIFLIFVSSCLLFSPAQMLLAAKTGNSDTPLTLGEAIIMGMANNPRITAVQSQVDASKARVSQARSGFFPQVDLNQSFNRTTNPMWAFGTKLNQEIITAEDFDPERLNNPDAIDSFAATVSVSLPVYDRGENWIGLNQAKLDREAFSLSADRIRQQVIVDIVITYSDDLLAHENLLAVIQTLETAKAHLKMVRSRFKSGLVVKSDLLRAEVRMAELEQERLQWPSLNRSDCRPRVRLMLPTPCLMRPWVLRLTVHFNCKLRWNERLKSRIALRLGSAHLLKIDLIWNR